MWHLYLYIFTFNPRQQKYLLKLHLIVIWHTCKDDGTMEMCTCIEYDKTAIFSFLEFHSNSWRSRFQGIWYVCNIKRNCCLSLFKGHAIATNSKLGYLYKYSILLKIKVCRGYDENPVLILVMIYFWFLIYTSVILYKQNIGKCLARKFREKYITTNAVMICKSFCSFLLPSSFCIYHTAFPLLWWKMYHVILILQT